MRDGAPNRSPWVGLAMFGLVALTVLFGLCTIFAGVVTMAEGWKEHSQEQWPEAKASVEKCRMRQSSTRRRQRYYIDCQLAYEIDGEANVATIYSGIAYASNNGPLAEWVDDHPTGTPVAVRYDPANHKKIVLMPPYMPGGAPHTENNVRLLIAFAAGFVVLLFSSRVLWARVQRQGNIAR